MRLPQQPVQHDGFKCGVLPQPKVLGFSEDPALLREHREKVARAIVALLQLKALTASGD